MQTLRFLHIPKTAGTTFTQILENQYKNFEKFQFSGGKDFDREKFESLTLKQQAMIKLFYGHAPIITGFDKIDSAPTITFLRDPVARVKSYCQHVSEGKSSYLIKQFPPNDFDLDKFLNSNNLELRNLQTKMLVNQGASALPLQKPENKTLEMAKSNLINKLTAFGLVESFDESLMMFKTKFDWQMPYYVSANKKNNKRLIQFESRHIARIEELNFIDIELYKFAKTEFTSRIKNQKIDQKQLLSFKKNNANQKQQLHDNVIINILKKLNKKLFSS